MSSEEKMWLTVTALVAVLVLLIGYVALISPQRGKTHDVQSQVDAAKLQNTQLSTTIDQLAAEQPQLPKYQADLAAARLALPSTSGLADFLKTLQSLDAATGVDSSFTAGAPTDVTSISGGTATASSTDPASSTVSVGSAHVYALPITAQVTGTVANLNKFLQQLQTVQPRAVLVSQITEATSTASGPTGGTTSLSLTMQAFVAPSSPSEDAQLAAAAQK